MDTEKAGITLLIIVAFAIMIAKGPKGALAERITEIAAQQRSAVP